jgi:hypothetical protein
MEVYSENVNVGPLKIQLTVRDQFRTIVHGRKDISVLKNFTVHCTAWDQENRRIWSTPVIDDDGKTKIYVSINEALSDARRKIGLSDNSFIPDGNISSKISC